MEYQLRVNRAEEDLASLLEEYRQLTSTNRRVVGDDDMNASPEFLAALTEHNKLKYQLAILEKSLARETGTSAPQTVNAVKADVYNYVEDEKHNISLHRVLTDIFTIAIANAYPGVVVDAAIVLAKKMKGKSQPDYQCNAAMGVFAQLKGKPNAPKTSAEVGATLVANIPANFLIEKAEVAGPGFVNLFLHTAVLSKQVSKISQIGVLPPLTTSKKSHSRLFFAQYSKRNARRPSSLDHYW